MGRCYLSPSLSIDAPSQNLVTKARPTYSLYYSGCYIPCMHIDETKPQYYLRSTTGKLGSPRLGRLNKIRISRHNHYGADQSRLMGIFMPFVFVSIPSLFLFSGGLIHIPISTPLFAPIRLSPRPSVHAAVQHASHKWPTFDTYKIPVDTFPPSLKISLI